MERLITHFQYYGFPCYILMKEYYSQCCIDMVHCTGAGTSFLCGYVDVSSAPKERQSNDFLQTILLPGFIMYVGDGYGASTLLRFDPTKKYIGFRTSNTKNVLRAVKAVVNIVQRIREEPIKKDDEVKEMLFIMADMLDRRTYADILIEECGLVDEYVIWRDEKRSKGVKVDDSD